MCPLSSRHVPIGAITSRLRRVSGPRRTGSESVCRVTVSTTLSVSFKQPFDHSQAAVFHRPPPARPGRDGRGVGDVALDVGARDVGAQHGPVMRLLWSTTKPVDFHGKFFDLENAVLGLEPYE